MRRSGCDVKPEGNKLFFQLFSHRRKRIHFEWAGNAVSSQILDDRACMQLISSGGPIVVRQKPPGSFAVGNFDGPGHFLARGVGDPDQAIDERPIEGFFETQHKGVAGAGTRRRDGPGLRIGRGVVRFGYLKGLLKIPDQRVSRCVLPVSFNQESVALASVQ